MRLFFRFSLGLLLSSYGMSYAVTNVNNTQNVIDDSQYNMINAIYFGVGSAELSSEAKGFIKAETKYALHSGAKIGLIGYSDPTGDKAKNHVLEKKRSDIVYMEFIKLGVKSNQLELYPGKSAKFFTDYSKLRRTDILFLTHTPKNYKVIDNIPMVNSTYVDIDVKEHQESMGLKESVVASTPIVKSIVKSSVLAIPQQVKAIGKVLAVNYSKIYIDGGIGGNYASNLGSTGLSVNANVGYKVLANWGLELSYSDFFSKQDDARLTQNIFVLNNRFIQNINKKIKLYEKVGVGVNVNGFAGTTTNPNVYYAKNSEEFVIGNIQAGAGVNYFINSNFGVFSEYIINIPMSAFSNSPGLNNTINIGVSYNF